MKSIQHFLSRARTALMLAAALGACSAPPAAVPKPPTVVTAPPQPTDTATRTNANAVKVEFFVMSQCPYGVQAVDQVKDAVDQFGPAVDFSLDYIGDVQPDGTLTSMHGPAEVIGDIAQLCAARIAPDRYLDMIVCQNRNTREIDTNWDSCARETGVPVLPLRACVNGEEGHRLLAASFTRSAAREANGSPTMFIAGNEYDRRRETRHFVRAICGAVTSPPVPPPCASLGPLPSVNVWVLGDSLCDDCDTDRLAAAVESRFDNPNLRVLDYRQPEGRVAYEEAGGGQLPLLLFDETLAADPEAYEAMSPGLAAAGRYRKLDVGGEHNPRCADDGGCKRAECVQTLACRPEVPKRLELFVMSQCPYGIRALDAMKEVLANFGNRIDFRIHYIASGTAAAGFRSLHGQYEVEENIRALCAIKSYGRDYRFMDYILCRNQNIRDEHWESCAKGKNAPSRITRCVAAEGNLLHERDIAIANSLGIGASPTWIVNGRHKFQGVDAETIRKNFCQHNPNVVGCENTLSGSEVPVEGGCGG